MSHSLRLPQSDVVKSLLEEMVGYKLSKRGNFDALNLQMLAAQALMEFSSADKHIDRTGAVPIDTTLSARILGKAGGIARAAALTAEQRSDIARRAAKKRWGVIA
jgi:hypothetical protein